MAKERLTTRKEDHGERRRGGTRGGVRGRTRGQGKGEKGRATIRRMTMKNFLIMIMMMKKKGKVRQEEGDQRQENE